jgi:hypothetical protein
MHEMSGPLERVCQVAARAPFGVGRDRPIG